MANSSDIAQSDLAELLTILGMGDHARTQSPHEVFQEALGVLRKRLGETQHHSDRTAESGARWQLVPVGPTIRMQEVGLAALEVAIRIHGKPTLPGFAAAHVWRAMLKEAPSPAPSSPTAEQGA